jgi:hypothetical protein
MSGADFSKESEDTLPQAKFREQALKEGIAGGTSDDDNKPRGQASPILPRNSKPMRVTESSDLAAFSRELEGLPSQPYEEQSLSKTQSMKGSNTQEELGLKVSLEASEELRRRKDAEEAKLHNRPDLASGLVPNVRQVAKMSGLETSEVGSANAPSVQRSQEESKVFGRGRSVPVYEGPGKLLNRPGGVMDSASHSRSNDPSQQASEPSADLFIGVPDVYPSFDPFRDLQSRATLGRNASSSNVDYQPRIEHEGEAKVERIDQGRRAGNLGRNAPSSIVNYQPGIEYEGETQVKRINPDLGRQQQVLEQISDSDKSSSSYRSINAKEADVPRDLRSPDFAQSLSSRQQEQRESSRLLVQEFGLGLADISAIHDSSQVHVSIDSQSHSAAEDVSWNLSKVYNELISTRNEALENKVREHLPQSKSLFTWCRCRVKAIKTKELDDERVRLLALVMVDYDKSNAIHTKVLQKCLELAKIDNSQLYGRHWGELGFDGDNPCLEFNTGIVGLLCITYLMCMAEPLRQALLPTKRQHPVFAEVCIKCAYIALDSLRKGKLNPQINASDNVLWPVLKFFVGLISYWLEDLRGKAPPRDAIGTSLKKLCKVRPSDIFDAARKVTKIAVSNKR